MLLHYQIRICISGHSKFDMDWILPGGGGGGGGSDGSCGGVSGGGGSSSSSK